MQQKRRIRLFLFGAIIGTTMVYFMLFRGTNRTYWLPENRIKEQMLKGKLIFSDEALCKMNCLNITEEQVRNILKNGDINFSDSQPHPEKSEQCPLYAFDDNSSEEKKIRILFSSCDSLSTQVITAIDLEKQDTCHCATNN